MLVFSKMLCQNSKWILRLIPFPNNMYTIWLMMYVALINGSKVTLNNSTQWRILPLPCLHCPYIKYWPRIGPAQLIKFSTNSSMLCWIFKSFPPQGKRGDAEYKRLEKIQTQMKDLNETTIPECTRIMDGHIPIILQQSKWMPPLVWVCLKFKKILRACLPKSGHLFIYILHS